MNKKYTLIGILLSGALLLVAFIVINERDRNKQINDMEQKQVSELIQDYESDKIKVEVNLEYNYSKNNSSSILVSRQEFLSGVKYENKNNFRNSSITYDFKESISDRIVLVRFVANNLNASSRIAIKSDSAKIEYNSFVYSEKRVYYIPFDLTDNSFEDISIEVLDGDTTLHVSDFEVLLWDQDIDLLEAGTYFFEEKNDFNIDTALTVEQQNKKNVTYAVEIQGNYIYELAPNSLLIYENVNDGRLKLLSTLFGLGSVRDMAFLKEGYLVITSRGNGAFVVDITNKNEPKIIAHINTSELVSGLTINENIVFFGNRYAGVEVYDLTEPELPKFVTFIGEGEGKEYIDCAFAKGYLYISCWAQNQVDIWDVQDLNNPLKVSTIEVSGHPYGITVNDDNLFIATGQHAVKGTKTISDYNYGTGNGFEIYDISNELEPIWKSCFKGIGRYFTYGHDNWDIKVSNNVAYFSDAYAGLFMVDVSNVSDPRLIEHVVSSVDPSRPDYESYKGRFTDDTQLFPFDKNSTLFESVSTVAIGDGEIFTANESNYIGYLKFNQASMENVTNEVFELNYNIESQKNDILKVASSNYITELKDFEINDIVRYNDEFFASTNKNEILRLDSRFQVVDQYQTDYEVKDMSLKNGRLALAYGNFGVDIYDVISGHIEKKSHIDADLRKYDYFDNVALSENGDVMVIQSGFTTVQIYDLSDITMPDLLETIYPGSLYYDNLFEGQNGNLIGVFGSRSIYLAAMYIDDYELYENDNLFYAENSRPAVDDTFIYFGNSGGISRLSISDINNVDYLQAEKVKIQGIEYFPSGKLFVSGDLLVSCNTNDNTITIIKINEDADGLVSYRLLEQIETITSPVNVLFTDKEIVVTFKKRGILLLEKDIFETR